MAGKRNRARENLAEMTRYILNPGLSNIQKSQDGAAWKVV
jgi:hypothetical protein